MVETLRIMEDMGVRSTGVTGIRVVRRAETTSIDVAHEEAQRLKNEYLTQRSLYIEAAGFPATTVGHEQIVSLHQAATRLAEKIKNL